MKNIMILITFVSISTFSFIGCKKSIDYGQLQIRDGIAFEVNDTEPYSGEVISYHETVDKAIKSRRIYSKGHLVEKITFFDNQQVSYHVTLKDGALLSAMSYFKNGQLEYKFINDPQKDIVKFDTMNDQGKHINTSHYLNSDFLPMADILHMALKSSDEILAKFGKVEPVADQNTVTFPYGFYKVKSFDCEWKQIAQVEYSYFKNADNSIEPLLLKIFLFYNSWQEQDKVVESLEKQLISNGFTRKNSEEYSSDNFRMFSTLNTKDLFRGKGNLICNIIPAFKK